MIWVITYCPGCNKKRNVAIYAKETEKYTKCGCGSKYLVKR